MALMPQAALADGTVLEPSDKWVLNYANDSCRLARTFGQGDDQVILILDQYQPAGLFDLSVVGKRFARHGVLKVPVSITFGPDLTAGEFYDAVIGTIGPDRTAMLMIGPRDLLNRPFAEKAGSPTPNSFPTTPDQEAAITELRIRTSTRTLTLRTGALGQPVAAMRKCLTDLVRDWGFDPAQQATLTKRASPLGSPGAWLSSIKYPPRAFRDGKSAVVRYRLMIDAQGVPTQCFIQTATLSPEFTKLTCDSLMKGARFSPALDSENKPIASYHTAGVRWLSLR